MMTSPTGIVPIQISPGKNLLVHRSPNSGLVKLFFCWITLNFYITEAFLLSIISETKKKNSENSRAATSIILDNHRVQSIIQDEPNLDGNQKFI